MIDKLLFKRIDNSALIAFRFFFGLLIFLEAIGAIFTGWVKTAMIDPKFTFSFIGFEWLQPLPGNGMYIYYVVMGFFGFMVMIGYRYKFSIWAFTLMWAATYFMQKSSYNNHYYLLILLCLFMCIVPAHRYASVDVKRNPSIKAISMPVWCANIFILQMFIVYTYAAIAKMYPDWLDTSVMEILMKGKGHYYVIGDILQNTVVHYFVAYGGLLFDLLIIPLLLWKKTRLAAFYVSIFFHMFNSIVFQVGIFPYMSLALCMFFFEPNTIRKLFLRKKQLYEGNEIHIPSYKKPFVISLAMYFLIQIALPLRHWFIKDNVLWTEEGHRLSWRMMLRSRVGHTSYRIVDKATKETRAVNLRDYLSPKQMQLATTRPDIMWQFAQKLKEEYNEQGKDIEVYISSMIRINGRPFTQFIDPSVDLASVKWDAFSHSEWILPSKLERIKPANP